MQSFQWDDANRDHIARHNVVPREVEEVLLGDALELEIQYVDDEQRFLWIGQTLRGRILVVLFTEREQSIRPITAYDPTPYMRRHYIQEKGESQ